MSYLPCADPEVGSDPARSVEMAILPRTGDIGGFEVRRALPFKKRRMVGPFIFWDQMGPGEFLAGKGLDVRPHPHIGLSTVTYLFDGSMDHKDSLGTARRIFPGEVNLMTAGRGVTHSERTGQEVRLEPSRLYGVQSWIAQPKAHEDGDPAFHHAGKAALPTFDADGVKGRVILGEFEGARSPAPLQWQTIYVDLELAPGAKLRLGREVEERALYALHGDLEIGGVSHAPNQMLALREGDEVVVTAPQGARVMLLGGAAMDGPRHIFWNFVSSSEERLEQAKRDWRARRFPDVPGDDQEFIPLPE